MGERRQIRVLIAGTPERSGKAPEQNLFLTALEEVARNRRDFTVVDTVLTSGVVEALEKHDGDVDVVVLCGEAKVVLATRDLLKQTYPELPVVVALDSVGGYSQLHVKNMGSEDLLRTIRAAVMPRLLSEPDGEAVDALSTGPDPLLERELERLRWQLRRELHARGLDRVEEGRPVWGPSPTSVLESLAPSGGAGELEARDHGESESSGLVASGGPLERLAQLFHLDRFDSACVVMALAAEVDSLYADAYALIQQDLTRRHCTTSLFLDLLCDNDAERWAGHAALRPGGRLLSNRLLRTDGPACEKRLETALRIDTGIQRFLMCEEGLNPQLHGLARFSAAPSLDERLPVRGALREDLVAAMVRARQDVAIAKSTQSTWDPVSLVVHLWGRPGSGRRGLVKQAMIHQRMPVIRCAVRALRRDSRPVEELFEALLREGLLTSSAVSIEGFDELEPDDLGSAPRAALFEAIRKYPGTVFLLGREPWEPRDALPHSEYLQFEVPTPGKASTGIWRRELERHEANVESDQLEAIADRYRMTPGQIRDAVKAASSRARAHQGGVTVEDLHAGGRAQATASLECYATRVEPRACLDDLVTTERQRAQLDELVAQAERRRVVFEEWGFGEKSSTGEALTALFTGGSGTGKTLAAEGLAKDLHLDFWKLNLAKVLSRYLGDLEQRLEEVFCQAEVAPVCLMLDEADSLLAKRSAVKDSRDRYANVEVAYLLQRLDEFKGRGVVVLATNMVRNLDEALVRRMRFIVPFQMPDFDQRLELWERGFPERTPRASKLDLKGLAKEYEISGGAIRNICLRAAFLAASGSGVVDTDVIRQAARLELQKMGRTQRPDVETDRSDRLRELIAGGAA